jgi:hypothetical protein
VNDADVVDRLTRTYAAVAAATPVPTPDAGELPPTTVVHVLAARPSRRPLVWAAGAMATAAALLLAVLVTVPRDDPKADSVERLATRMRHATLGVVPKGFGLISIGSSPDADVLGFSDGTRELRVITARESVKNIGFAERIGQPIVRGHQAILTVQTPADVPAESVGTGVEWIERPGIPVRLFGTGTWEAKELLDIAEKVMMVSDASWAKLIRNNGFAKVDPATDDHAIFDPSFPGEGGEKHLDRSLDGSLQTGVGPRIGCCLSGAGAIGVPFTNSVGPSGEPDVYLVWATAPVASVRISLGGKVLATVTPVADPGIPTIKVASVALPDASRRQGAVADFLDANGVVIETTSLP